MTTKKAVKKEDKQLVFLRRLVKTLGIILVVGTVFVFSVVVNRLLSPTKYYSQRDSLGKCSILPEVLTLPVSGDIISVQREEKLLTLALRDKDGQKVLVIDLCEGKILQTVQLEAEVY